MSLLTAAFGGPASKFERRLLPDVLFPTPEFPITPTSAPIPSAPTSPVDPGSLTGYTQSGSGPFGVVPQVPSPGETSKSAIEWNLENLPAIHQILNDIDLTIGTRRGIIGDKLSGMVPGDVEYLLAQRAAERGIGGGSVNADYLKALGLTSLGLQREGGQEAGALANEVFGIQSPMFVTPGQAQEAQYMANLLSSMPNPALAAKVAIDLQNAGRRSVGTPTGGGGGGPSIPTQLSPSRVLAPGAARGTRDTIDYTKTPGNFTMGFNPGPGFGGEEFDVPFDGGGVSPLTPSFNQIPGFGFGPAQPTDYVSARTGSEFDYGMDDYGTGWANFPGFEFMDTIAPQPSNFVEARTNDEYDWSGF